MRCRICGESETESFSIRTRNYEECPLCGSITLSPECFETEEGQRTRYEKHHNSLEDDGYRSFLEQFIIPVLNAVPEAPRKILDYGSGPEPALCELLRAFASDARILSPDCEIRGWDPFFSPETAFFEEGADLVTCLEVAEHFETPLEDMKKLASACRPNGYVAIGTMLLPGTELLDEKAHGSSDRDAFKNWWYRSDSTHVAFYSREGLIRCAAQAGLSFEKAVSDRAFLFRRKASV